jgi:hypothetical protein
LLAFAASPPAAYSMTLAVFMFTRNALLMQLTAVKVLTYTLRGYILKKTENFSET